MCVTHNAVVAVQSGTCLQRVAPFRFLPSVTKQQVKRQLKNDGRRKAGAGGVKKQMLAQK